MNLNHYIDNLIYEHATFLRKERNEVVEEVEGDAAKGVLQLYYVNTLGNLYDRGWNGRLLILHHTEGYYSITITENDGSVDKIVVEMNAVPANEEAQDQSGYLSDAGTSNRANSESDQQQPSPRKLRSSGSASTPRNYGRSSSPTKRKKRRGKWYSSNAYIHKLLQIIAL